MKYSAKTLSELYLARLAPASEAVLSAEISALSGVYEAIKASPLLRYFTNPTLSAKDRGAVAESLLSSKIFSFAPATKELFLVLAQDRRIKLLPRVLRELRNKREKLFGVTEAEMVSAIALSETQKKEVAKNFSRIIGKNTILREHVDPSVLGGILVRTEGILLDATLKRKMHLIHNTILS